MTEITLNPVQVELILNMQARSGPVRVYASGVQLRDVGQLIDAGLIEIDPQTKEARLTPAGKAWAPDPAHAAAQAVAAHDVGKVTTDFLEVRFDVGEINRAVEAAVWEVKRRLSAQVAEWRAVASGFDAYAAAEGDEPHIPTVNTARAESLRACADDLEIALMGIEL